MNFFNIRGTNFLQELHTGQGFFVMFFRQGKDFFKELFVNISSPVPSINNVQSLREHSDKKMHTTELAIATLNVRSEQFHRSCTHTPRPFLKP